MAGCDRYIDAGVWVSVSCGAEWSWLTDSYMIDHYFFKQRKLGFRPLVVFCLYGNYVFLKLLSRV